MLEGGSPYKPALSFCPPLLPQAALRGQLVGLDAVKAGLAMLSTTVCHPGHGA